MFGLGKTAIALALLASTGCLTLLETDNGAPDCPDEPCETRSSRIVVPGWSRTDAFFYELRSGLPGAGPLELQMTWEGGEAVCDLREEQCEGMAYRASDPYFYGATYDIDDAAPGLELVVLYDGEPMLIQAPTLEYEPVTYTIEYTSPGNYDPSYVACDGCPRADVDFDLDAVLATIEQVEGYPGACDLEDPEIMAKVGFDSAEERTTIVDDGRLIISERAEQAYAMLSTTNSGQVSLTLKPHPDEGPHARRLEVVDSDCRILAADRSRIPGVVFSAEAGEHYTVWVRRPTTEQPDELVVRSWD